MLEILLFIYIAANIILSTMLVISFMGKLKKGDILALILCLLFGVVILIARWAVLTFKDLKSWHQIRTTR